MKAWRVGLASLDGAEDDERIEEKGQAGKGCNVQRVRRPRLLSVEVSDDVKGKNVECLPPHMSLRHETGVIAAPIASSPSRTLIQKLYVVFQRRLNLTLHVVLNPGLPLVRD